MTGVALVAIIALAAGGVIVVLFAIAHVGPIEDTEPPEASAPPARQQVAIQTGRMRPRGPADAPSRRAAPESGVMPWAPADAPSPRAAPPEPLTAVAPKPLRRSRWHDIRHAWRVWRYRHADELRGRAGWVALVVFSAVLAYLVAHL